MMSSDQHPDEPARTPEGETSPSNEAAPAPAATEASHTPEPAAASHDAEAHADADHADASDGDDEEGDDAPAGGEAGSPAGDPANAATGTPGKKKRRRRRKKKGDASVVVEGGAAGEGTAITAPTASTHEDRQKKKDRPRHEQRERPPFGYGDVVFGKITEITDDAIMVDLSGKAFAIFDRRELDLPDDLEYGADGEVFDDETAPAVDAVPAAEPGAEAAAPEAVATAEAPVADATPAVEVAPTETAARAAETAPELPEGEEAAAAAEHAAAEHAAEEAKPAETTTSSGGSREPSVFPVTKLEVGADFIGIVHNDGGRGGLVVLTRHPKRVQRAKLVVGGAFKEKGEILGLVTGVIKGGVEVDVDGLRAFAPGSHMDLRLGVDLHPLVGKRLPFLVTQYAKRGKDVVLSRKPFLEAEAKLHRQEALKSLKVGTIVEGTVRSVVTFGAFLDIGGVEGLVPLAEMSHNRGDGPHDVFKVGEKTPVKILNIDDRGKVWLSRRAATPDPWIEVAKKYAIGTKIKGKVVRLQPFGAFVELEPGIDGLIHTADLSMKRIEHPNEVVKEGEEIDVVVVHLEIGNHKIGLHPAPTGEAADETPQRVILHKPVKVMVVGYEPNGLIVRILGATGRNARGFISAAATGTPRGTDLRREFPMNKAMEAKVTELDPRRGELKLSVKALSEDTERSAYRQYREQVTRTAKFGTFADLLKKNVEK